MWFLRGIELGLPQWELTTTIITMLPAIVVSQIWQLIWYPYHSPELTPDIFPFPGAAQDIFLYPTTPGDLAESIYMIAATVHQQNRTTVKLNQTSPHPFPSKFYPQYPLTLLQPILNPIPVNLTSYPVTHKQWPMKTGWWDAHLTLRD